MRPISTLIIAIIVLLVQSLQAQEPSRKETEEWLLKKLQIFSDFKQKEFQFDEKGNLILRYNANIPQLGGGFQTIIFPLNTIDALQVFENKTSEGELMSVSLVLYSSNKTIEFHGGTYAKPEFIDYMDSSGISFMKEVKDDDMIIRIKKAFIHLIELNGGKIKKDVF